MHARTSRLSIVVASILTGIGCAADPPVSVSAVIVRVTAQEATWHASYLLPPRPGLTNELPTEREVHVPLGAEVSLVLASRDYIADFTLPQLGLRDFAAPGLPSELHFRADRPGRYELRSDEFCGLPHTDKTRGSVIVEDADTFRAWIRSRAREERR
jgi:cytochrome c oxidase subunit 2